MSLGVFADFTLIDSKTRVTGIPRVAFASLEEGDALMDELGCEVLPVSVRDGALRDACLFLLFSNLRRLRRTPSPAASCRCCAPAVSAGATSCSMYEVLRNCDLISSMWSSKSEFQPMQGFSWPGWGKRARMLYPDLLTRSRAAVLETPLVHPAHARASA